MSETEYREFSSSPDGLKNQNDEANSETSLKSLILILWYYRRTVVVLTLCLTFIIAVGAAWVYSRQTRQKFISLEFKLEFEGIDKHEYANGLKFSTGDILSTPVLNEVYEENDLKRYLEYPEFKAGLTIFQTNDELRFLEYEYADKLSRKNINLEKRDRLEAEFLEKKNNVLVPIYTLSFRYSERMKSVPEILIFEALNDILRIWANHADRVKGVNKYQYFLVSRNILSKKDIEDQDYFITTDMLRTTVRRIIDDSNRLQQIPGAEMIKVGENGISLQDIQFRLEDIQQFKLSPLVGLIRQSGVSKDEIITLSYLRNRLFELKLKKEAASARVAVYENTLSHYIRRASGALTNMGGDDAIASSLKQGVPSNVPAMIPQFGASFLDSLIEMAQENSDMLFRQEISAKVIQTGLRNVKINTDIKYYEDLYERIYSKHNKDKSGSTSYKKAEQERIQRTHKEIYDILMQTIDEVNAIYLDLSKYHLNPESLVYSITKPVLATRMKPLSLRKTLLYVIFASIFAVSAIVIGILLMNNFTGSRREKSV